MTFWQFAHEHWFLTFVSLCVILGVPHSAYKLRLRAKNIEKHGWPPTPLDADGDVHSCECEKKES